MTEAAEFEAAELRSVQAEIDPIGVLAREFDYRHVSDEDEVRRSEEINLEAVLDIPVTLSIELGRTRLSIRELLALSPGAVVRLDRPAGEPLDILVNGCLLARGEVVVVNDRFGIRITEIASPEERLKRVR